MSNIILLTDVGSVTIDE